MNEGRIKEDITDDLRRDFVDQNALKTHNFDKFWFHILWVAVLILLALGVGLSLWLRQ